MANPPAPLPALQPRDCSQCMPRPRENAAHHAHTGPSNPFATAPASVALGSAPLGSGTPGALRPGVAFVGPNEARIASSGAPLGTRRPGAAFLDSREARIASLGAPRPSAALPGPFSCYRSYRNLPIHRPQRQGTGIVRARLLDETVFIVDTRDRHGTIRSCRSLPKRDARILRVRYQRLERNRHPDWYHDETGGRSR